MESRTQGSRPRPRTQKKSKAKDRNARGQGPRHKRKCSPKKKKKVLTKIFQAISKKKKRSSQKFFKRSPQKIFKRFTKFLQFKKYCCPRAEDRPVFEDLRPRGQGLNLQGQGKIGPRGQGRPRGLHLCTLPYFFYKGHNCFKKSGQLKSIEGMPLLCCGQVK